MTTITTLGHEDASVRTVAFENGVTLVVANDPDTRDEFCWACEQSITPVVEIVVLNDEEWDYAENAATLCPLCWEESTCRAVDADQILREIAEDARAEYLYDARKEAALERG